LAWVAGCIPRWFVRPKTVTPPGTNHAGRRVTSLIAPNVVTATPRRHAHNRLRQFYRSTCSGSRHPQLRTSGFLLWPPCIADADIIFSSCFFFFLSFFLAQRSQIGCLPYFYTRCGLSANLDCRSEMCCTRLTGNAGPKKSPKNLHTIEQLCRAISLQLRHLSTIRKKTC